MEERPISDLRDTGLLWLINTTVFHPRGYALALIYENRENPFVPGGKVTGWRLYGDGTEPWQFNDPSPEDKVRGARSIDDMFKLVKEILP